MDIYYCSFWFDFESSNNFLNNKCCCCCFETIETVRMHAWTASSQIILRRKTHTKILWMFYTGNSIMYKIVADSHQISLKIPQKYYRLYKIAFYRFICVSITMTCFSADFCYILRWSSTDLNSCWNQTRLRISHSQKKQRMNEQSKHINTKNGDNMQICPIHWHQHFVFWRRMPKSNWEKKIYTQQYDGECHFNFLVVGLSGYGFFHWCGFYTENSKSITRRKPVCRLWTSSFIAFSLSICYLFLAAIVLTR